MTVRWLSVAVASVAALADGYEQAAAEAAELWAKWAAESDELESTYSSVTAADDHVLIFYPKGTSSSKLSASTAFVSSSVQ